MKVATPMLAIIALGLPIFAQPAPQTSANSNPTSTAAATVQFSSDLYQINKNESGSALIGVARSGATDGEATVTYTSKGGTANPGSDYTPAVGELKFASGETRKTFSVPIMETPGEGSTTVNLELSDPQNAVLGKPAAAVLSIMPASAFRKMSPAKGRVLKHLGVTAAILGLLFLSGMWTVKQANKQADKWSGNLLKGSTEPLVFPQISPINAEQQARMQAQLASIRGRLTHHKDVMAYFYAAYYMSIVTFSIAAAIAAVTLVLVSQNGWQSANEYIVNIFFTSASASAFFGSFPGVFQQQKNITDNKVLCIKYLSLENELLSYSVTGEGLNYDVTNVSKASASTDNPAERAKIGILLSSKDFLHYVDLQLSQDNVTIGFDYQQVANYKNALAVK